MTLTEKQGHFLELLSGFVTLHPFGALVRVARALEALGLVELRDDGRMGPGGNFDGERWTVTITPAGLAEVAQRARKSK